MKNILIIVSHSILPPNKSGSKLIYEFCYFMCKYHNISVIQPKTNESDDSDIKFFNILTTNFFRFFNPSDSVKIVKYIKKNHIETVIFQYPWFLLHMIFVKLFTKTKIVMHEHNIEYQRFRSTGSRWRWILYLYERLVYKIVDDVLFITKEDQKSANQYLGFKGGQYCPYGVNTEIYNNIGNEKCGEVVRKLYNIDQDKKIAIFFGSHSYFPNRQAVDIIESVIAPELLKEKRNGVILICGGGLDKAKYFTHDNVIYTGFVDDIVTHVKGSDLMINPIISGGGVKTKVIEALMCGIPVISTEFGAIGINIALFFAIVHIQKFSQYIISFNGTSGSNINGVENYDINYITKGILI